MSPGRKLLVFTAIAFVPAWAAAISFGAFGGQWGTPASAAVFRLYTLPPALAALAVTGAMAKEPVLAHLGLSLRLNRWWLLAWLLPVSIGALAWLLGPLVPGVAIDTSLDAFLAHFEGRGDAETASRFEAEVRAMGLHPSLRMLMQAMVAGVTLGALSALGEELGWRGFLHHELRHGFWRKSLRIGLVWGVWHAPIAALGFAHPENPITGVPLMMAWCVATAPICAYVRERSGSVVAAGIFYGTLLAIRELPLTVTRGGSDVWVGMTGLSGIAATLLVVLGLWVYDRRVAAQPIIDD